MLFTIMKETGPVEMAGVAFSQEVLTLHLCFILRAQSRLGAAAIHYSVYS